MMEMLCLLINQTPFRRAVWLICFTSLWEENHLDSQKAVILVTYRTIVFKRPGAYNFGGVFTPSVYTRQALIWDPYLVPKNYFNTLITPALIQYQRLFKTWRLNATVRYIYMLHPNSAHSVRVCEKLCWNCMATRFIDNMRLTKMIPKCHIGSLSSFKRLIFGIRKINL